MARLCIRLQVYRYVGTRWRDYALDFKFTDTFDAFGLGEGLNCAEFAFNLAGGGFGRADFVGGFLQFFLGGSEEVAKLRELGFDGAEGLPDFGGTLLNRHTTEAHGETGEDDG